MPVERSKDSGKLQRPSAPGDGGNSKTSAAAPGKKRKKKKKTDESSPAGGAKIFRCEEVAQTPKIKDSSGRVPGGAAALVVRGSSALLKSSDQYSSSSSIENSKPTTKVGRFDSSSSDAMSIGGHTSASSSAAMDVSSNSGSLGGLQGSSKAKPTSVSLSDGTEARPAGLDHKLVGRRAATQSIEASVELALESLRWERECSDEEKEKERLEVYKENRRKRYENALAERKAQLSLHSSDKVRYYF